MTEPQGYEVPRTGRRLAAQFDTIFALTFDDPDLAGLEVKLRRSYGLMDSARGVLDIDLAAVRTGRARPQDIVAVRALVADFSGALVSWNLHRAADGSLHLGEVAGGKPVGTDLHTVRGLSDTLVFALVAGFLGVLTAMAKEAQDQLAAAQIDESSLPMILGD